MIPISIYHILFILSLHGICIMIVLCVRSQVVCLYLRFIVRGRIVLESLGVTVVTEVVHHMLLELVLRVKGEHG